MKQNQSSRSAAGVGFFPATEPETGSDRICYDPYAHALYPGFYCR